MCVCVCLSVCELCHSSPGLENGSCYSLCARPGGRPSQALLSLLPQVACILMGVLLAWIFCSVPWQGFLLHSLALCVDLLLTSQE